MILPRCASNSKRWCLLLHFTHDRLSDIMGRALQLDFHAKPIAAMVMFTKWQLREIRSMDLNHVAMSLCDTKVDATKTPTVT